MRLKIEIMENLNTGEIFHATLEKEEKNICVFCVKEHRQKPWAKIYIAFINLMKNVLLKLREMRTLKKGSIHEKKTL
jgi:hypothetical protein